MPLHWIYEIKPGVWVFQSNRRFGQSKPNENGKLHAFEILQDGDYLQLMSTQCITAAQEYAISYEVSPQGDKKHSYLEPFPTESYGFY